MKNSPEPLPDTRPRRDRPVTAISADALSASLARRALPTLIALIVVAGVAVTVLGVLGSLPHSHLRLRLPWLGPAILALAVLELAQAGLWQRLLRALGATLPPASALAIWCVSAVARYVPTSLLMPIMRVRMSRRRQVRGDVCLASVVYEAVLVNCGAACIAAYFVITLPALRGEIWRWGILLLPLGAAGLLHPRPFRLFSDRLLGRIGRLPLPIHLSPSQLLRFTAGYVVSFLVAGIGLASVVLMLHPLSWQALPTVMGAMAIGFIASALAFVLPGGLGAREAALILALSPVLPTVVATAASVAVRLIQLGIEVLLALLLPLLARRIDLRLDADKGSHPAGIERTRWGRRRRTA